MGWCFAPITGGRVSEIISQVAKQNRNKNALPVSKEEDKIEKFYEDYKDFIDVNDAYERFNVNWEYQILAAGGDLDENTKVPVLRRALTKSFSEDFYKAAAAKLVWSVLVIFSIWYFVFNILDFIKARGKPDMPQAEDYYEYYLSAGFLGAMFVLSIGIQQMGIYSSILGSKVKAALTTAIFKKMIVREAYGSKADVVSLVAKDVEKLAEASLSVQYLWSGIFETVAVFVVLWFSIKETIFPGLGLMCVFLPLQYLLGVIVAYRKKALALVSNRRISLMEEIMRGIKLIKIYGWEDSFFKNLNNIRDEEGFLLLRINRIKAAILGLTFCLPPLMCMVIFGTQEATGKIETVVVFTTLSFFNTLRVPFSKLPKSLRDVLDAFSCFERIQAFLLEPELATADDARDFGPSKNQGIIFENVSLSYGHDAKMVLSGVNLNIPGGSLMMVAGPVAGGKSNLLKSILGDLTVRSGTCIVSPSKAYVPQTPWTALGTVRDNILFGNKFDAAFYRRVIHACALEPDLKMMEGGDQMWIGERGGNLSGGQKQRIALARAAYSRADLYVLDSPLSAVDMYTCQHIFQYCIQDLMIAGGGTVVLATHQTELFSKSDHLVVMKDGQLAYNNKYSFQGIKHLFPNFHGDEEADDSPAEKNTKASYEDTSKSESGARARASAKAKPAAAKPKPVVAAKKKKQGDYTWYIHRMGVTLFSIATLVFIIGQIMRVYSDAWISTWSKRKFAEAGYTDDVFYAGLYAVLVHVFLFLAFLRAYVWFYVGKVGATNIHDMTFGAALRAPMHFFHVTPIGKLLSFFSKDVDTIDDVLVDNTCMLQIFTWILILALGVVAYNIQIFLALVAGLFVVYAYVVMVFLRTSAPLKEVGGEATSQVVAHTSETLSGLAVVRAFRMQDRFVVQNLAFQQRSTAFTFSLANLSLWLAFRVDIIGCLLVIGCCLLALIKDDIEAPIAGLIVSNSFQILLFFSIMSRTMGEVQDNMGAIDRARELAALEAEKQPTKEQRTPEEWPSKGEIRFDGVVMPYLPGTPPVLKGINFSIKEGEKIGVVGRTGAGKSSLIVALYRLAEISSGSIFVDGVDCSKVSLNKLRRSMAIIPQEPVMFSGTIRTNLDPFHEHEDEALVDVLEKCLLGPMLDSSEDGLDTHVEQLGSNFSLGTQQLICLARAMLNPSRILLLDEATAALDSDTNNAVQVVLKAHFSNRTIFTIAHRLDTIVESDRILTMNAGVIAEFDHPATLLDTPTSIFRELCMNAGKSQFAVLYAKAHGTFVDNHSSSEDNHSTRPDSRSVASEAASKKSLATWQPSELREFDSNYQITMDLPGVRSNDLTVRVDQSGSKPLLNISGRRRSFVENEEDEPAFETSFSMDDNVNFGNMTANLSHGVLVVNVPKNVKPEIVVPINEGDSE
jgi:ABC-type multidrug transport system fused ATPase/permease subunit/HSP20 family molecular chaperone IbpA